jgi:DNA-binding NtrC family response regulator
MEKQAKTSPQALEVKLPWIESLVEEQKFKEAWEEIKLLEDQKKLADPFTVGHLSYLSAVSLYGLGQYQKGLEKCQEAFDIFKETGENTRMAQTQYMMGRIFLTLGDLKSSEMHLRDAISTYRRIGDSGQIIRAYNIIARIHFVNSDFKKALETLKEAIHLAEKLGDQKFISLFSGNLGRAYTFLGQWNEAEKNLLESLRYSQAQGNETSLCRDLLALGYLYLLKRDFPKAERHFADAFLFIQKNGLERELAIYHEYSGILAFQKGGDNSAEKHYNRALQIGEKIAPSGDLVNQCWRLLAELEFFGKEYLKALSSCQKSLKVSLSLGDKLEEGAGYRIMGQIHSALGEKQKAKEYFTKSISTLQEIGAKFELANTYLKAGESTSFDYYQRLGFLSNAENEFAWLDSKYYVGEVNLAIALLLLENEEFDKIQIFLNRAQTLFEKSQEKNQLLKINQLKQNIQLAKNRKFFQIEKDFRSPSILTQNSQMLKILDKISQIKDLDINILLIGETGTGKDILAKLIHFTSKRRNSRFVAINCSAVPESLLENELFGHKKGAYTGASCDETGIFEETEGGTLYLDEIADVALSVQVKLLRAIEEKEIIRLGDTKTRKVNVRIISSTNRDIEKEIAEGAFRQDLFYRLNTINIRIPPLRERKEDIPLLIKHFLKEYGVKEELIQALDNPLSLQSWVEHDWPGNIRELENETKRIVVLSGGDKCSFCMMMNKFKEREEKEEQVKSLPDRLAQFEKEQILKALIITNWIQVKAAQILNIDESLLRYKMKKYGIKKQGEFNPA